MNHQEEGRPENLEFSKKLNRTKITIESVGPQGRTSEVIYAAGYLILADVALIEKNPEDPKNPAIAVDTDVATSFPTRALMIDIMEKVKHSLYRQKVESL